MLITFGKILLPLLISFCSGSPVSAPNANTGWTKKEADICLILDCSSSVWIVDFNKMVTFVADLVSDMDIGLSSTRVAVAVYSENFRLHIPINNTFSKEVLKNEIKKAPYLKGNAFLSRALQGLREQCLPRSSVRPNVPRIAVVFTDGMSRHKQLTADNSTLVKQDGIFLFSVGIGNDVDRAELRAIASDPKPVFSHYVADFDHLIDIRSKLSTGMSGVELFQGDEGTCGEKTKVDTIFVFDEAAIGENDTQKIKTFIMTVVNEFSVNSGNVRIGVVSKTCHEGDIALGQYVTKEDLTVGLKNNDGPEISILLKRVRQSSFLPENGARPEAKSRIILILHANVVKTTDVRREAQRAKFSGTEMFVIQVGNDFNKDFIMGLASSIDTALFFNSADDLLLPKSQKEFTNTFCREL